MCYQCSAKDVIGQLWFGTLRGGLYRYNGRHFQQLSTEDGLPSNSVTGLMPQPDGSMIISTYHGIVHLFVPPLREREGDIPLLAEYFYRRICEKLKKELKGFASGVLGMLSSHRWPGNVRELEHAIEAACILAPRGSEIQTYHFPEIAQEKSLAKEIISERIGYNESVMQFRRQLVESALKECEGNRTRAAKLLGMKHSNLVHLIKEMKLDK